MLHNDKNHQVLFVGVTACGLNIIAKVEGLLKVTGSHVHWRSGNVSETMLNRDVVTTGH